MPTQGASITVQGGLDLVSSSHALFRTPGAATKLQNFESATTGGYRRISGYQKWGGSSSVIPSGVSTDSIHGIIHYNDGVLVAQGDNLYYSNNGTSYLQVNKDTFTAISGTVSINAGSSTVLGAGTTFTTDLHEGDILKIDGNYYHLISINSNTNLTIDINAPATKNNLTLYHGGLDASQITFSYNNS